VNFPQTSLQTVVWLMAAMHVLQSVAIAVLIRANEKLMAIIREINR
jgi:hypothetical protein